MKAVLSEIELRESIRRALMKSLMLEGDEIPSADPEIAAAPPAFNDKIETVARALIEKKSNAVITPAKGDQVAFVFDDSKGLWFMQASIFDSRKGATLQQVMNNQDLKASLEAAGLPGDDLLKILMEIQAGEEIKSDTKELYKPLEMTDSGPAGLFFTTSNGRVNTINLYFSGRKIAEFVVGARQKDRFAGSGSDTPFDPEIEKKIDAIVPSKDSNK